MNRTAAALALVALFLSGCSGGGGGGYHATPPTTGGASNPSNASGGAASALGKATFGYGAAALAGATAGTHANLGFMKVSVALKLTNPTGLATYAAQVSNPTSSLYRHFLTPQQIASQYGATQSDVTTAANYFKSFGLAVGTWKQRLALTVSGSQSAMEAAFHTQFYTYTTPKGTLYGPKSTPSLSATLPITGVAHLIDGPKTMFRQSVRAVGPGSGQNVEAGYSPGQIAAAFNYTGAWNANFTGTNINVGIIGTGPIDMNDFTAYEQNFGFTRAGTISQVDVGAAGTLGGYNGATGTGNSPTASPPPVTGPCNGPLPACNPEDGEAQIDVEQVAGLARSANVLFYLAYVPDECYQTATPCPSASTDPYQGPAEGIEETDDEIQQAINDDTADILSLSFGGGEQDQTYYFLDNNGNYSSAGFGPTEFAALAAEGIAVFVSSGDSGSAGCARDGDPTFVDSACVSYPASDVSVTSVGGVTTPLNNAGQFIGPLTGWGVQTQNGLAGSGGGVSAYIPLPSWQTGTGIVGSTRNQPDVSLEADDDTGVYVEGNVDFGGGSVGPYGGTSVAAPEMAAMWATVLDACKQTPACVAKGTGPYPYRFGNPAPLMYQIYNNATLYPSTFYDVTYGSNAVIGCLQAYDEGIGGPCPSPQPAPTGVSYATQGYDRVTGIGVPFARHLITAVVGI